MWNWTKRGAIHMSDKISVIIPIFNVEEYLAKCLDSVMNQTYKNLEIILVNDGSTDSCGEICDNYAQIDNRIKVVHKKNGGLSDARNAGLDIATGNYIGFVDSDDWVDCDMYEFLMDLMMKHQADIAICRYRGIYNQKIDDESTDETIICDGISAIRRILLPTTEDLHFNYGVVNKLYKRDFFHELRFPVGVLNEDVYVTPKILYSSKQIVYKNVAKYNYLIERPGSIMNNTVNEKRVFDELAGYKEIEQFFESKELVDLTALMKEIYLVKIMSFYFQIKSSNLPNKEDILMKLSGKFKEDTTKETMKGMSSLNKAKMTIFSISPSLYSAALGSLVGLIRLRQGIGNKSLQKN